jgi:predicted TPR repeat methyltransferase
MKTASDHDTAVQQTLESSARAATARQDWVGAARLFHELAMARPETPAYWHNLALAEIRGGNPAPVDNQRRAVLLRPSEPNYLNNLTASAAAVRPGRVISWLLALAPDHARAWTDQAFLDLRASKPGAASRAARNAQIVEPGLPESVGRAAQAQATGGHLEAARVVYRRYLLLEPSDQLGVGRDLARFGGIETGQAMSRAFLASVFDGYATNFDAHLTETLRYVGPMVLARMLDALVAGPVDRAVDLGCGSGLSGLELRRFARHLTGVDLSAGMLERARGRDVYDTLHHEEIVAWLEREEGRFEIAMAADVTSYLGDLAPFFRAVSSALAPGGLLAMTAHEQGAGDFGIVEGETYSHSHGYVEHVAREAGLTVLGLERGAMREENKQPLPTLFFVFGKD